MNEEQITYKEALISLISIQELCKNRGMLTIAQSDIDKLHTFMKQNSNDANEQTTQSETK